MKASKSDIVVTKLESLNDVYTPIDCAKINEAKKIFLKV